MDFADKVVLITGGSQGIGTAIAVAFAAAGARVAVTSRSLTHAQLAARSLLAPPQCTLGLAMEVQEKASVTFAIDQLTTQWGVPDVLVHSAGVAGAAASETLAEAEWDRIIDTNLKGTFLVNQAVGKLMLDSQRGVIVNLASVAGQCAFPRRAAYGASKAGVIMLTKVLAVEWAERGVRVNAIAPAVIRTELNERMIAAGHLDLPAIERRTPLHRRGEPSEVAAAAMFLASEAARYITGTCLEVDGGWTAYGFL